ncbi:MAG: 4-hydroxy-tetrahydrodipicolinate synthase [bacterium]|nr:4-hydroxy-tetrahydrodipicolinate synthase [bacterium]MCP4800231.1 4-hydroxy-tetrahydrodipicolinate synthase [bacterium]
MTNRTFEMPDGIYTALVTPFLNNELDKAAWERLVARQIDAGVSGIVPVGCTGEAAALSLAEREWMIRTSVEMAAGKCIVVAGSGTNVTASTIEMTALVKEWGADVAMLISPYYNKPQQSGLAAHYRTAAENVDIPILLYNVPGRTGVNLLPETVASLDDVPNIIAVKEACGNLQQIETLIGTCDLKVFSGDDGLNFNIFGLGARGAVSVVSNIIPVPLVDMWNAWEQGDISKAWWISRQLDSVCKACFVESNPVPVKQLLANAKLCGPEPRLPLVTCSQNTLQFLENFFNETISPILNGDQ